MTALRQGSTEWLEARRVAVSSTDLASILGLSPYRSESDLADEKLGRLEREAPSLPMRVGLALEPLIREEYERMTGARLRRVRILVAHPTIPWAVASPDYRVVGERQLVEAKWTSSSRWDAGLPQDVEAQVQWCLGVTGLERADVAVLVGGRELRIHPVEFDAELFEGLLELASGFRARLASGGPFAETLASLKRRYPRDDGSELAVDAELDAAVRTLLDVRGRLEALELDEERLEVLIRTAMGEAATAVGSGWRIYYRKEKERTIVDWQNLATGLLRGLPELEREAVLGLNTRTEPGRRPFKLIADKGEATT